MAEYEQPDGSYRARPLSEFVNPPDPITPERVTLTDEHQAALHRIWREAAESNLREGVDWPRVARDLFKTLDELSDRLRSAQADAWDECAQALAWCLDNGPPDAAPVYVADHNPYRDESETP